MSRVCIVGDSHVVALKQGWEAISGHLPETEIVLFAAGHNTISDLRVEDGAILPASDKLRQAFVFSAGTDRIEAGFDRFILCSMGFDHRHALKIANKFVAERFRSDDSRAPISDDCFTRAILDTLATSTMFSVAQMVRRITGAPITAICAPFGAVHPRTGYVGGSRLKPPDDDGAVAELFHGACRTAIQSIGGDYLPQPVETLGTNCMTTAQSFAAAPARIAKKRGVGPDYNHMNADYGAIVMAAALNCPRSLVPVCGPPTMAESLNRPRSVPADCSAPDYDCWRL